MDISTLGPLVGSLIQAGSPFIATALQMAIGEIPVVGGIVGPLAGMALPSLLSEVAQKLGLPADTTPQALTSAIQADPQAAQDKLAELESQHTYELAQRDRDLTAMGQQTAIVQAEIAAPMKEGWFGILDRVVTTWWRPATAWGLASYLGLDLVAPYAVWALRWAGHDVPDLPPSRFEIVASALGGLLGLGAFRSFDKLKGTTALPAGSVKTVTVKALPKR